MNCLTRAEDSPLTRALYLSANSTQVHCTKKRAKLKPMVCPIIPLTQMILGCC